MIYNPPTLLIATAVTRLYVDLSWAASEAETERATEVDELRLIEDGDERTIEAAGDPPDEYAVYRDGVFIGSAALIDGLVFTDSAVVIGATYRYTVAAWDGSENLSDPSEELIVTIPAQEVYAPVVFADLGSAKPRVYAPKENLTVRGQE